eukprot:gene11534-7954_t
MMNFFPDFSCNCFLLIIIFLSLFGSPSLCKKDYLQAQLFL